MGRVSPAQEEAGRGLLASGPAWKHVAFRVESSISHSMCEMGPEGQGQLIKVSDQRWLLQGFGGQ